MGSGARVSADLFTRAKELLPGGVNSPVRAMKAIGRDPIFVERGEGAELIDVEGNRYVDWMMSWGPLVAGHAHPDVIAAVTRAAERGTSFGAPTEAEVALAAEVADRVPGAEMVRMTSSGTEATMSALRLARAATGRDAVVKFAGAYHGHVDGLLADAGSGLAAQGIPASRGVTEAQARETVVVPWNDRDAVARAFDEHRVAALVCEPYPANMGLVVPEPGFLEFLREHTHNAGALLVFDEVITGFRVARGGAQQREDVVADLTILGKVIGGGLPAAAYAGWRELMEEVAPAGDVYQAGTLSGNPLATAAGLATLNLLDAAAYERLEQTTAALAEGLIDLGLTVSWVTGLLTAFFRDGIPRDLAEVKQCDFDRYGAFCRAMLDRGVYLPPSQYEAWFPSLAHTEEHVERTLAAAREALAVI